VIVNKPEEFLDQLEHGDFPANAPACVKAVMMVEPAAFSVSTESAVDNHYMNYATTQSHLIKIACKSELFLLWPSIILSPSKRSRGI